METRVSRKSAIPIVQVKLTPIQARRLASVTGLPEESLVHKTIGELEKEHQYLIDPQLFLFRLVKGKVVKKDPVTGEELPVPHATVHVWDTDLSLLHYAPPGHPWAWFFPLKITKEEIGTAKTNDCGEFTAKVPRWDIDHILQWKKLHVCYPWIFRRPDIRDLLEHARLKPYRRGPWPPPGIHWPWPPPEPDPFQLDLKGGGMPVKIASELAGPQAIMKLAALDATAQFGDTGKARDELLDTPVFQQDVPPPLTNGATRLKIATDRQTAISGGSGSFNEALELPEKLSPELKKAFDPHHYLGPFMRCFDVMLPVWTPILDVPDITFTVNQDANGDGTEELVYGETFFQVRWDASPLPPVKLYAWENALAGLACGTSPVGEVGQVSILLAGKMPLHNPLAPEDAYVDTEGYAHRVNRPRPGGDPSAAPAPDVAARSPFCGSFPLMGCNHFPGACYYRLTYEYQAPGASGFASAVPFSNLAWTLYRWTTHLETRYVAPDPNGWYEVLPVADHWMPEHLLLNWVTGGFQNGTYRLSMEFQDGARNPIPAAVEQVILRLDNSSPSGSRNGFTALRWRVLNPAPGAWSEYLSPSNCLIIHRPAGKDIEFEVSYQANVDHWRALYLSASACGTGNYLEQTSPAISTYRWHSDPAVNSATGTATFKLAHAMDQGSYGFNLRVDSRAFNPDDANGIAGTNNWYIDPLWIWGWFDLPIAVVDA